MAGCSLDRARIEILPEEEAMTDSGPSSDIGNDCAACPVRTESFCAAVPNRGIDALSRGRRLVRFDRRQTIVWEGSEAVSFFNVVSGVVKLYRSLSSGRTQIIGFCFPGDFFATSETGKYTTTAEAITFVEACRFPRARLKRLTHQFPELQAALIERSYRHTTLLEDQIVLLGRMTAREKIVGFLLKYGAGACRAKVNAGQHIHLPMTREEIADYLGLTTETVSRVLTSLAREKLITVGISHSVHLIDVESLKRISGK